MNRNKFLIIGKLPPPIGGVTIHVYRLLEHLKANNINHSFYDLKKITLVSFICAIKKHEYCHIHTSSPLMRVFFAFVCLFTQSQSIVTIHGNLNRFGRMKNFMDKLAVKFCNYPVLINKNSYNIALKINYNSKLISAYIPQIKKEILSSDLENLLCDIRKKYSTIVATNAYAMSFDKKGEEIYGIDFLINFFQKMEGYVLVISDPSGDYNNKYSCQLNKEVNIKIIAYPHSFINVLEYSDIFIRNTSTDGDSLSIHEAIDIGVPVIATNIIDRPDEVYLINRNDEDALMNTLFSIQKKQHNKSEKKDNLDLIKFYKKIQ